MKYEEYENGESIDLYSSSGKKSTSNTYEDISSTSPQYRARQSARTAAQSGKGSSVKGKKKGKKRKTHRLRNTLLVLICLLLTAAACLYGYAYKTLSGIERTPLDENDLGIATADYGDVRNIALLGIDTREDNLTGRSDAIVILTIDKKHRKIKLTSIARDTYVSVDGHSKDKLTHAYAYGKSQLAVKTLNQNFDLEIEDYVTVNFYGLARVIDYIGGVTVDVDEKERVELNSNIFPEMRSLGFECPNLTATGSLLLNGPQAVCYARIRHTDSDIMRGNRQKEVLTAMFAAVKKMNPLKLPKAAKMVISECETSLTTNDIIGLGTWALVFSPEFEQLSVPNDNVTSSGKTIGGVWYYVYDLNTAKKEIRDFIFEENYYSAESVAARATEE
ncbi:MAG: LCP family protein [Acutalibacteraceae bacterium]